MQLLNPKFASTVLTDMQINSYIVRRRFTLLIYFLVTLIVRDGLDIKNYKRGCPYGISYLTPKNSLKLFYLQDFF